MHDESRNEDDAFRSVIDANALDDAIVEPDKKKPAELGVESSPPNEASVVRDYVMHDESRKEDDAFRSAIDANDLDDAIVDANDLDDAIVDAITKHVTNAKSNAAAYNVDNVAEDDTPDAICCPITQDTMNDPVLLVGDGHTYEREAIETWLIQKNTSPLTNEVLTDLTLVANHAVKKMIDEWCTMSVGTTRRLP
jgi:hypothetical protein